MGPRQLDLSQAPPIAVPLRFFLTAPLFAAGAAVVALWYGGDVFASRFTPATLAIAHLLALGCLTMVMAGALMQIVPVLAGVPIAHSRAVASIVHPSLTLGTLVLAAAFLSGEPHAFVSAAALLGVAFAVLVGAVLHALLRTQAKDGTVRALRRAALALGVTVVLGICLALHRALGIALPVAALPDLHPGWALFGWIGLLVAAVAQRVVPMFQLTPAYPAWLARHFGDAVLAALVAWSVAGALGSRAGTLAAGGVLAALYVAFACVTLALQRRRRRRVFDVNLLFWRAGMVFAIVAVLAFVASAASVLPFAIALAVGVLALTGAALSLVNGMLYRIMPFLAWFHLYSLAGASPYVPNLKDYLAESRQRWQLGLHLTAIVLLAAAAFLPDAFARIAALAFVASAVFWQANLLAIVRVYLRHARRLAGPSEG
jgi:hypothetical protein